MIGGFLHVRMTPRLPAGIERSPPALKGQAGSFLRHRWKSDARWSRAFLEAGFDQTVEDVFSCLSKLSVADNRIERKP